jgi:DNA transformation protein and related proteins
MSTPEFTRFIRDQLSPLGAVTVRRTFGKVGVFCEGVMFGMVAENMRGLRKRPWRMRRSRLQSKCR